MKADASGLYTSLPDDEEDESEPLNGLSMGSADEEIGLVRKDEEDRFTTERSRNWFPAIIKHLLATTIVLSLIISIASLFLLVLNARTQWRIHDLLGSLVVHSEASSNSLDAGLLERPSVYIGLDKLPLGTSQTALPQSLDVFPPFFQPVDHIHRNFVFPSDGHARFTFNGRVSPGDHRVLLTDHITMIAQFRVHDYGMERCRIVSSIPTWELLQTTNQTLHLAGDTSSIEIWNLTTPGAPYSELDERTLSWETKPPRERVIGTVGVAENSTHKSDEFWCGPSGSLQTFELVCRGVSCYVELWQDYYFKPRFGIYIQQSPSL